MAMLTEIIASSEAIRRKTLVAGWVLVVFAVAFLVFDLVEWRLHGGSFVITSTAWLWYVAHKESLSLAQQAIEGYVWRPLWSVIELMLAMPVFVIFGGPGLVLLYLGYFGDARGARR